MSSGTISVKVRSFWEANIIWKRSSSCFWRLLSKSADLSKPWGNFFLNFVCFSESLNFIAAFLRPYCYERRDYIWGSLDIISKVNNVTGINLLCLSFLFFLGLTKLGNIEEFFNQNFFKKTRKSEPKERSYPKGQLISKCLFWYLQFFQKTNKKIRLYYDGTSSRIIFVRFLEELKTKKRHFEINWPLKMNLEVRLNQIMNPLLLLFNLKHGTITKYLDGKII
jgi:hypothetical protein